MSRPFCVSSSHAFIVCSLMGWFVQTEDMITIRYHGDLVELRSWGNPGMFQLIQKPLTHSCLRGSSLLLTAWLII